MNYNYADIVLINFDPTIGNEIKKSRPAIIVSNNIINQHSPFVIVVPLTTTIEKQLSFHVQIKPSNNNKLNQASKALTEQIKSLDKRRCIKKVGSLDPTDLRKLEKRISFAINQWEPFE